MVPYNKFDPFRVPTQLSALEAVANRENYKED